MTTVFNHFTENFSANLDSETQFTKINLKNTEFGQ